MSDGTDFTAAMRDASEESLDDLAHYRPNRHGRIDVDCFGKGYRRVDPSEEPAPIPRTYPEDGCPVACTQCATPFLVGQIIHPELDGTRCIPCFKAHWRDVVGRFARNIHAAVAPKTDEERERVQKSLATIVAAAYAPPVDDREPIAVMREAVASLGDPSTALVAFITDEIVPAPTPAQFAEVAESYQRVIDEAPRGVDLIGGVLEELTHDIEANAVGRCHKCGSPTANPESLGSACSSGLAKEPEERCRGYMHALDATADDPRYFHA